MKPEAKPTEKAALGEYVCGFMFNKTGRVALIRKGRPEWQAGRFNGIGGHVGVGETARQAMVREFAEETGQATFESDWRECVVLTGGGRVVRFFRTTYGSPKLASTTDEAVGWYDAEQLPAAVLPNLHWLIPLCLDDTLEFPVRVGDNPPAR